MTDSGELRNLLCEQWCADLDLEVGHDELDWRISLPVYESDGDAVTVWIQPQVGGWQLRDCGTTMMRLSYDMDVDLLQEGTRSKVLQQLLAEGGMRIEGGELFAAMPERQLGAGLMQFAQTVLRISDISLWSRSRVASTFYEDLQDDLMRIVGPEQLVSDYIVPNVSRAEDYPVDFAVTGLPRPFYIFGVLNTDKAKLTTIILQHLRHAGHIFDSLVIPSDIDQIKRIDLRRLMNAANDFVDSRQSKSAVEEKIRMRLAG